MQNPDLSEIVFFLISCFHGWNGDNCTTCERLPGCQHGGCSDKPHTCDCEDGWKGILCDEPICEYAPLYQNYESKISD